MTIVIIAATFFAAGLVKGVTGMGLPTVAMSILSGLLSPLAAATLLVVPSSVTNVWQLAAGGNVWPLFARFWPMMVAIVVGTSFGSFILADGDTTSTTVALGIALTTYAIYTLFAPHFRIPQAWQPWASPLAGVSTGIIMGATGVSVIPAAPYLQALGLERDELVQALGMSFTISTVTLAIALYSHGSFQLAELATSTLALIPAAAGMCCGQWLRYRISPPAFRRGFLVCLLLLGLQMAVHPLFSI